MSTPTQIVHSRMVDGCVASNTQLTARLYALRIELQLDAFQAGQFVRLELEIAGEKIARPYSLVNPPGEAVAEVFFNTVPGGLLSNALAGLTKGDRVGVSQPATGFFVLDGVPAARDIWMFATGTGLGPYLSLVRTHQLWDQFENVVLVQGVPVREELVYQDVITTVADTFPQRFHVLPCISREESAAGFSGRVTDALASGKLEETLGIAITPHHSSVMLCGNHNMIQDMQALLGERGLRKHLRHKPGHIVTEQYF